MNTELLESLCAVPGVSGAEGEIRRILKERLLPLGHPMTTDKMGNLIVAARGKLPSKHKIMVCAHMDEVGLIIKSVDDKGFLRFDCVGGIDARALMGKSVLIGPKMVKGVIGVAAIHLIKKDDRNAAPAIDKLYIDIGANSREEALESLSLGDTAVFLPGLRRLGDGFVRSKALDDRAGCAVMVELLEEGLLYDTHFVFTVQEEVGLRGAQIAARTLSPDICLIVETTTAADFPGVEEKDRISSAGEGAVISAMDRATIYDRGLVSLAVDTAQQEGIAWQMKKGTAGGNDAGGIQRAGAGVKVLALSMPCRFLHSPSSTIKEEDYDAVKSLCGAMLRKLGGEG